MTSWQPGGFGEILFLSKESHWQVGKAIRGGIPVCFPWFRGKPDDKEAPTHGFVRTKQWRLYGIGREPDDSVTVMLSTESDGETLRLWQYDFLLEYLIRVGESLTLELKMQNTGGSELHFQEALHTFGRKMQPLAALVLDAIDFCSNLSNSNSIFAGVAESESGADRKTPETI